MSGSCLIRRVDSPVGPLLLGAHEGGVCLLEFAVPGRLDVQVHRLGRLLGCDAIEGDHPLLRSLEEQLAAYFAGQLKTFTVPLSAPGTAFQQRVWSAFQQIPYGETRCYEDIAIAVGTVNAQRAVGMANGANRLAILIPCHRVVNKDGRLGGYGGLLWRKQMLLGLERTGTLAMPQPSLFGHDVMASSSLP